jgi:hypothetical protein
MERRTHGRFGLFGAIRRDGPGKSDKILHPKRGKQPSALEPQEPSFVLNALYKRRNAAQPVRRVSVLDKIGRLKKEAESGRGGERLGFGWFLMKDGSPQRVVSHSLQVSGLISTLIRFLQN